MPVEVDYPKARKIHPGVLGTMLTNHPVEVPNPLAINELESMDPIYPYDGLLLNDRLASVLVEGIDTTNLRTVVGQVLDKENELAFGAGFEGAARQLLTSPKKQNEPFSSKMARFENPGEIWIVTKTIGDVFDPVTTKVTRQKTYGLVPLNQALFDIDREQQRRVLSAGSASKAEIDRAFEGSLDEEGLPVELKGPYADKPDIYDVEQVLILPPVIADYTRALQSHARRSQGSQEFDVEAFRKEYFDIETGKPTEVLRKIKQEYLGDTTWGTILTAELLIRLVDYGIGQIPVAGPVWDFLQASTGKEFPLPLMERSIRRFMRDRNLPLPEGVLDKPGKGRWLELVDTFLGALPYVFPPALLAKIPVGTIMEGLIYTEKMENARKYFNPFLQIAESTGTKPRVIDKVEKISKMPGAVIKDAFQKLRKQK